MESVHIIRFYEYPCCIWPVYTWGKEWAHTWWETKECLQEEQRDLLLKPSSLRESWVGCQPAIPSFKSLWNVKSSTCHCFTWIGFLCQQRDLDDWFCSNKWRLPKWEQTGYISRAWVSALITYVWPTQRQEGSGELLSNKREDFKDPWQEVVGKGKPDGLTRSGWLVWEHLVFPGWPCVGSMEQNTGKLAVTDQVLSFLLQSFKVRILLPNMVWPLFICILSLSVYNMGFDALAIPI